MTITQQEIIDLAVEAGFPFNKYGLLQGDEHGEIDADEMFARLAALLLAKETKALQAAQLELEQCRNEAWRLANVLIKEAYQRGGRDEREAAAKICDERAELFSDEGGDARSCANAIRARGQSCQARFENLVYERAMTAESQLSDVVLTKIMTREERKAAFLSARKNETPKDCQSCPPCNHNCNQGRDCEAKR